MIGTFTVVNNALVGTGKSLSRDRYTPYKKPIQIRLLEHDCIQELPVSNSELSAMSFVIVVYGRIP